MSPHTLVFLTARQQLWAWKLFCTWWGRYLFCVVGLDGLLPLLPVAVQQLSPLELKGFL